MIATDGQTDHLPFAHACGVTSGAGGDKKLALNFVCDWKF